MNAGSLYAVRQNTGLICWPLGHSYSGLTNKHSKEWLVQHEAFMVLDPELGAIYNVTKTSVTHVIHILCGFGQRVIFSWQLEEQCCPLIVVGNR